jgi:putative component of toxin-antitoxin plasmid stabilization module
MRCGPFSGESLPYLDGERLVILIGGGTKKRQQKDIATAQACWSDYKRRKRQETQ